MDCCAKTDLHAPCLLQPVDSLLVVACGSWSTMPSLMCMHCSQRVLLTVWYAGHGVLYCLMLMPCGCPDLLTISLIVQATVPILMCMHCGHCRLLTMSALWHAGHGALCQV